MFLLTENNKGTRAPSPWVTHCCKYALSPNKTIAEHFSDMEQSELNNKVCTIEKYEIISPQTMASVDGLTVETILLLYIHPKEIALPILLMD